MYEGMFLFDAAAAHDWNSMESEVRRLCDRIGGRLEVCLRFDDQRKLAFEIKKRKRGTYVLTYFQAPPNRIGDLDRDVHLSEVILRHLVLRTDELKPEKLAELKAWPHDKPYIQACSTEPRRGEDGEGGPAGEGGEGDGEFRRGRGRDRDRDRDREPRGDGPPRSEGPGER